MLLRCPEVVAESCPGEVGGGVDRLQAVARISVATLEHADPIGVEGKRTLDVEPRTAEPLVVPQRRIKGGRRHELGFQVASTLVLSNAQHPFAFVTRAG